MAAPAVSVVNGVADSLNGSNNVTAPGASAVLASIVAPPDGVYEIRIAVSVGAGAVAADNGNARLSFNNATKLSFVPTNGAELIIPRATLSGGFNIILQTIGAGTAAVVYTARITISRLEV